MPAAASNVEVAGAQGGISTFGPLGNTNVGMAARARGTSTFHAAVRPASPQPPLTFVPARHQPPTARAPGGSVRA